MSLSKVIIYSDLQALKAELATRPTIDEVDTYGYSPLIQTAIMNDAEKARLLLDAGGDPNFTDLTGRTALHWSTANHNTELCKLLLDRGARVNAHTGAGQSVLVIPLLRHQEELKKLLYQYGADLNFAQDFINAKSLGHRFELEGRVDIVDPSNTFFEMEYEGFYLEFTLAILINSLIDFKNNFGGKHLRPYFNKLDTIIDALKNGEHLVQYQHYLAEVDSNQDKIHELLNFKPLLVPVAFAGHATALIRLGNWLIRCDRGEFGKDNGTVIIYRIPYPERFDNDLVKTILYKRQTKDSINCELVDYLGLEPIDVIPLAPQLSGNCSWSNIEASIPAIMFLLLLQENKEDGVVNINECKKSALYFYEEWQEWDKNRALHFCTESFEDAGTERQISKAAILASILFQRCTYGKAEDESKAQKILPILTQPQYEPILKSYVQTFSEETEDEYIQDRIQSLANYLDEYGIDIHSLK